MVKKIVDRNVNESLKFNQETEFVPILGMVESELNAPTPSSSATKPGASSVQGNHHPQLLSLLAEELSIKPEEIHDFELYVLDFTFCSPVFLVCSGIYTTRNLPFSGASATNLSSLLVWTTNFPRMCIKSSFLLPTQLASCSFAAVEALAQWASSTSATPLEGNVNCIALFNHEEVGSVSTSGADSSLVPTLLERLSPTPSALAQSVAKSLLVSADMGHALHPNYASKHEENHAPKMNGGIVIKTNAKQRYASDAIGTFLVKKLVERKGGYVQEYEARNDMYVYHYHARSVVSIFTQLSMQAMWLDCRPYALQDRYPYRGRRLRTAVYAFHPRDCRIS
jgi:aspartyl aminopeptidase